MSNFVGRQQPDRLLRPMRRALRLARFVSPFVLFFALLCCGRGLAASCDSLCQLSGTLAQGQWKQLVAPSKCGAKVSNFSCHALGYECGNPATNGDCWCRDFDATIDPTTGTCAESTGVETTGSGWADFMYGAYNNDIPLKNVNAFSAAGIRKSDGAVLWGGGGHAVTQGHVGGDSTFHFFNAEAAAANLNSGGNGGNWSVGIPGGRLRPSTAVRPSWSQQNCGSNPFVDTNKNGQEMAPAQHDYWGITAIPGTSKWAIGGSFGGCGSGGSATRNSGGLVVDVATNHTTLYGSTANSNPVMWPGAYDPVDGNYYSANLLSDAHHIYRYAINNGASNYARQQLFSSCADTGNTTEGRIIIFPDPSAPTSDSDFLSFDLYNYNGRSGTGWTFLREHMHGAGGTTADQCSQFLHTVPGSWQNAVAYNDDNGTFLWADKAGRMWRLTLNFTTLGSSTITKVLSNPTGTVPACTDGGGGGNFMNLQYLPSTRSGGGSRGIVELVCNGLVYITPAP